MYILLCKQMEWFVLPHNYWYLLHTISCLSNNKESALQTTKGKKKTKLRPKKRLEENKIQAVFFQSIL